MRKMISMLLVALMIIGMMGCTRAVAQENDLEELIGLKIKVWQDVPTNFNKLGARENACVEGQFLQIKGNWIILKCSRNKYVWCYISEISRIEISDKNYIYKN